MCLGLARVCAFKHPMSVVRLPNTCILLVKLENCIWFSFHNLELDHKTYNKYMYANRRLIIPFQKLTFWGVAKDNAKFAFVKRRTMHSFSLKVVKLKKCIPLYLNTARSFFFKTKDKVFKPFKWKQYILLSTDTGKGAF